MFPYTVTYRNLIVFLSLISDELLRRRVWWIAYAKVLLTTKPSGWEVKWMTRGEVRLANGLGKMGRKPPCQAGLIVPVYRQ